jgi:hypothetical protein
MKTYITTKDIIIPAGTEMTTGATAIQRHVPYGETWIELSPDTAASFALSEDDMKLLPDYFQPKE